MDRRVRGRALGLQRGVTFRSSSRLIIRVLTTRLAPRVPLAPQILQTPLVPVRQLQLLQVPQSRVPVIRASTMTIRILDNLQVVLVALVRERILRRRASVHRRF